MEKYTYKDSGIEWLGDIPEHWDVTKIKKEFKVQPSNVNKKSKEDEEEVLLCNYVDVYYNNYITNDIDFMDTATASENEIKKFEIKIGDVIITKDSEDPLDIGVPALVKETQEKLLCGYHLSMLRSIRNKIDGAFLFWSLNNEFIASQLFREATGVTRWAIASRHVKNSSFAYPPKQEQKAIAEYLDKATTKIDRIIAIKQKQLEKMEESFFSKLDSILTCSENSIQNSQNHTGFINRYIPNDWKIDRLRDVAIINENKLSNKTNPDFILNYIDIGNVNKYGIIDKEAIEEISFEEAPSRARRITKMQDTIISSVRTNLQAVAFIDFEIKNLISSTGFFVCRPKYNEHLRPKFLYYFLLTVYSRDFFFSNSMGVSYPAINDYRFGSIYIFIPPPDTQDDIVDKLDTLRDTVQESQDNLKSQIEALQEYRKSLIHECVTGKKQIASAIKEQTYA